MPSSRNGQLVAISDLRVEVPDNRRFVADLRPDSDEDWLIVCGDVGDVMSDIEWRLGQPTRRFAQLTWVPGNHEFWLRPDAPVRLRGNERFQYLVSYRKGLGIATPEDPYHMWCGAGGPLIEAPLFTLYDHSLGMGAGSHALERPSRVNAVGVVCSAEFLLSPEPYSFITTTATPVDGGS